VQRDVIDNEDPTVESADIRCAVTALVRGYGVHAFTDNGLTPDGVRRADTSLDDRPAPTDAQLESIGAGLQRCAIAAAMAPALAEGLQISDHGTINCFAGRFASDPNARRFLVLAFMDRPVDLITAHQMVGLVAACVDLPSWVLQSAGVVTNASTRACLLDQLKDSEALLKDLMALKISHTQPDLAEQDDEALGVSINVCRPGSHEGFTVPSSG